MAVAVNLRGNRYYAHRIVTPNGTVFEIDNQKDTAPKPSKGVTQKGSLAKTISTMSDDIVTDGGEIVKQHLSLKDANIIRELREQYDAGDLSLPEVYTAVEDMQLPSVDEVLKTPMPETADDFAQNMRAYSDALAGDIAGLPPHSFRPPLDTGRRHILTS